MTFNTKSFYALNKKEPNKIIYPSVTNATYYIELKDGIVTEHYIDSDKPEHNFCKISCDITADTFRFYKAISDEDYYETDRKDIYELRETISIHDLEETLKLSTQSCEDEVLENIGKKSRKKADPRTVKNAVKILDKLLTPTQKRRYILHYQDGKTFDEIADIEKTGKNAVWKSVKQAEEKIKKNFKNFLKRGKKGCTKRAKKVDR